MIFEAARTGQTLDEGKTSETFDIAVLVAGAIDHRPGFTAGLRKDPDHHQTLLACGTCHRT